MQRRLLVVGQFRVYSIKRSKNGKKTLQREGPILEVKTLELTDNPDEIVLYWQDFNIHVLTPNAYNVAQLVRHRQFFKPEPRASVAPQPFCLRIAFSQHELVQEFLYFLFAVAFCDGLRGPLKPWRVQRGGVVEFASLGECVTLAVVK